MNKQLSFIFSFLLALTFMMQHGYSQLNTPAPSPSSKVIQEFGLGKVTIDYSRPGAKGRKVMGDLVPFGKIWRTGANASTKITFSDDVTLEGNEVKAGTYALYSIPGESEWTIMLYSDLALGGNVAKYDESKEVLRFTVASEEVPVMMETFTITMDEIKDASAKLLLAWEKTIVPISVTTDVDTKVMAMIDNTLNGPNENFYFQAAMYYFNNDKDINKAVEWINKSGDDKFWVLTQKARIMDKAGKREDAIEISKKAMQLAEENKNADYVKINKDLLSDWEAM